MVTLTAGGILVRIVLAVPLAVAELRARNALVLAARRAARTQVLVVGARDGRAVGLVRAVAAVRVAVAVESSRDAERIAAAELADVARREACNAMYYYRQK